MSMREITLPSQIEGTLLKIWDKLSKENTTRACLFNLLVYTKLNPRSDYTRTLVEKVAEKYPCRILFISSDPSHSKDYLKTAVSVVIMKGSDGHIACDTIDIGVSGKEEKKVPSVILPHLVPDLPVYLLWVEDFSAEHPLLPPLAKLVHKIILDSESSNELVSFTQKALNYHIKSHIDIADLNWARMEPWRDLIAAHFYSPERLEFLQTASHIEIAYNEIASPFFCHLKIQALYLQSWLASRLGFSFQKMEEEKNRISLHYKTKKQKLNFSLLPQQVESLSPGSIFSLSVKSGSDSIAFQRDPKYPERVLIRFSTKERCDIPHPFVIGKNISQLSLAKEIIHEGTSAHYLEVLQFFKALEGKTIC